MLKAKNLSKKYKPKQVKSLKELDKLVHKSAKEGLLSLSVTTSGTFIKKNHNKIESLGYYVAVLLRSKDGLTVFPIPLFLISNDNNYIIRLGWL